MEMLEALMMELRGDGYSVTLKYDLPERVAILTCGLDEKDMEQLARRVLPEEKLRQIGYGD